MPREERIGQRRNGDDDRQQRGIDSLRHEEVGYSLDVGDSPAPFVKDPRDRREGVVEQNYTRDSSARWTARAHGDAQIGLLEGLDVVDTVADHGHDMALLLECANGGDLLLGSDPAEHVGLRQSTG